VSKRRISNEPSNSYGIFELCFGSGTRLPRFQNRTPPVPTVDEGEPFWGPNGLLGDFFGRMFGGEIGRLGDGNSNIFYFHPYLGE